MEHQQKPESVEGIFQKDLKIGEIKNEIAVIKSLEEKINRNDLIYESNKYRYDFRNVSTKISFGDSIFNSKITVSESDKFWILIVKLDQNQKQTKK